MRKIDIIVPVFNEEDGLSDFFLRLKPVVEKLTSEGWSVECIFVDDGSTDGSYRLLESLAHTSQYIRTIRTARNYGHQAAIWAGITNCREDSCLLAIDSDLQDPPELIPDLLEKLAFADVVLARRKSRVDNFWKTLTADIFYRVIESLTEGLLRRQIGDFWALGEKAAQQLRSNYHERHIFLRGMIQDLGLRVAVVDYVRDPRARGVTKYSIARMLNLAVAGIAGFTIKPLVYISYLAIISAGVSTAAILFFLLGKVLGFVEFAPGVGLGFSIVLGLTAATHMALAVISIYLAKISVEVIRRPTVAVLEESNREG